MKSLRYTAIAGFAMFSMFFGSGNLVFPLIVGLESVDHYGIAFMGLFVTAVLVPFLGLIAMVLYEGNREKFFSALGKWPSFLLTFLMLGLMGPLGVVPRCITVAYGGLVLIFPSLSLGLFSLCFCMCIGALILSKYHVVDIIGVVLTPLKLGMILFLIVIGYLFAPSVGLGAYSPSQAFNLGLMQGYQTMDLIASFFFSATTVHYLRKHISHTDQSLLVKGSLTACCIGGFLLMMAYLGFVSLGAFYAPELVNTPSESLLVAIIGHALGAYAMPFVGMTLAVACLATAVILSSLFADFLQQDISLNKLSKTTCIYGTLGLAFLMSLLGFSSICQFLGGILEIAYPAFIAYTFLAIIKIWYPHTYDYKAFWVILLGTAILRFAF